MKHYKEIIWGLLGVLSGITIMFAIKIETPRVKIETKTETKLEIPTSIELPETPEIQDLGDLEDEEIPVVEEVDGGGKLQDSSTSSEAEGAEYFDLGAIESVDTSSPDTFTKSTLNRCIIANNYYGAQCVSLARAFWWDYAGRDVSTCGTGLAKGMMNCAEDNAGEDFEIIYSQDEIISGTWVVFDGSYTGHICFALNTPSNGYVDCLGENQGGKKCFDENGNLLGGSATNIIRLSLKNFIGGYIPISYIPLPDSIPETSH